MFKVTHFLKNLLSKMRDVRSAEYAVAEKFLLESKSILDVGCGTGTFIERNSAKCSGVEVNPENVAYCVARGLNVTEGSALQLPFEDNSFDAVFCSHLLQVFSPDQAATAIKEIGRVVRPGGVVVISTLNSFKNFYQHPENSRPYPPDALLRYFYSQKGSTSPMWPGMARMRQVGIWLRHPPLVKLRSSTHPKLNGLASVFNAFQYGMYIVKPWEYDSYVIKLISDKRA